MSCAIAPILLFIPCAELTHLALQSQHSTDHKAHCYREGGCLPVCESNTKYSAVEKISASLNLQQHLTGPISPKRTYFLYYMLI